MTQSTKNYPQSSQRPGNLKPHRQLLRFLPLFLLLTPALADIRSTGISAASRPSLKKDKKVRSVFLSQTMSPGIASQGRIPDESGNASTSTYTSQVFWIDYALSENTRLGFWQRSSHHFLSHSESKRPFFVMRNPRFKLQKIDFWQTSRWKMSYDVYVQPGLALEARPVSQGGSGRSLEWGIRTYQTFLLNSQWTSGLITETTHATSFQGPSSMDFYGLGTLWFDHFLSSAFSNQHYINLNFQHLPNTPWYKIGCEDPLPFLMQNGITYHWNQTNTLSLLINHSLRAWPTFKNTSLAFWLTLNLF